MGFINNSGLLALIGIPIIIILYLLRPKNAPYTLPSLYLWKSMVNEIESASQFQKFKSSILMFLQIALVILIALMLAGLFRKSSQLPDSVILVVDCSVSMQATDIEPTRMDKAKEQAKAYISQLENSAQVTLIALKDIPEILTTDETDHSLVKTAIDNMSATDTYGDINLALQTTNALKKEGQTIIYFGDRTYPGAENVIIENNDDNVGVNNVTYTCYEAEGVLGVLADIANEGSEKVTVPISLYIDNILFDAKQVDIEPNTGGKVFFDNVPISASELKVEIDRKDILDVDNTAYTVVTQPKTKKVVLVTNTNTFLEKVLKLNQGIELYLAKPADADTLNGFDLYIYDGVLPTQLPKDGAILMFDPPENNYFIMLGYAKNSELFSAGHTITSHIEKPTFSVGVTQVFELPKWAEDVMDTEYGSCAFAGIYEGSRIICFGFDLHNTDLPLVVDFPIIMSDTLDYLIPGSLLQDNSISAGGTMGISINPSTEMAYVINPDGSKEDLDISQDLTLYKNTYMTGIYQMVQKGNGQEVKEFFGVNVPRPEALQITDIGGIQSQTFTGNRKSLYTLLGSLALLVLIIEWFIYQYRRKINAVKL